MNIAHFNYGIMIAPRDDPAVAGFVDHIDAVEAVAARTRGYVWNMVDDIVLAAAAADRKITERPGPIICSFSVWKTVEHFEHFLHKTLHGGFLRRRGEWFVEGQSEMVLWPVADGHIPDIEEAIDRLEQLRAEGPGQEVFTLDHVRAQRGWCDGHASG
jgi:hypothetical protein